jgi:hypothetical protein
MNLSDKQFEALAGKLNDPEVGGFTADMRRGGATPRNKYMVGQRDVQEGTHALPSTGSSIRGYAEANSDTLMTPGRYLGGWAANAGNLDVPTGFPRTPQGEVEARRSTISNDQIAYGELNSRANYVGDRTNPFHSALERDDEGRSTGYSAPKEAEQQEAWTQMPLHSAQFKGPKGKTRKPRPNHSSSESFS